MLLANKQPAAGWKYKCLDRAARQAADRNCTTWRLCPKWGVTWLLLLVLLMLWWMVTGSIFFSLEGLLDDFNLSFETFSRSFGGGSLGGAWS